MTSCDILSIVKRNQDGEVHMFSKVYLCHDDANFAHPRCDRNLGFPTPNVSFFCFLELRQFGIVCGGNFFASNLDQLFGVLSRRLSRSSSMVDADSVCQILEDEVKKPSLQKWVNAKIIVGVVRRYRNWKAHNVENCPVQLETLL